MKKCPFCAEEIQNEAIVCKHCRRELVPLQPVAKSSTPPSVQAPVNIPANPKIALAMQKYIKAGYKVVSASGDTANLERPAQGFNWCWIIALLLLTFIGVFIYLAIVQIWAVRKSYHVQLTIGPDEEVQELGDTIEIFNRDMLKASQKRHFWFGIDFCVLAALVLLMTITALITGPTPPTTWSEHITAFMVFLVVLGFPLAGLGVFLLRKSKSNKQQLEASVV